MPAEMRRGTRGSSQSVRWARHSIVPSSAHLLCVFIGLWSSFSLSPAPFAGAYVLQLHPAGQPATFHTSHLCVQQRRLSCVLPTRLAARRSDIRQVLSALVPSKFIFVDAAHGAFCSTSLLVPISVCGADLHRVSSMYSWPLVLLVQLRCNSENGDLDDLQPEEALVERALERLETGIESAASQERFKEASALRDEISRMHMDDTSYVLKVTMRVYSPLGCLHVRHSAIRN